MVDEEKAEREAKRRRQNGMDSSSSDSGLPDWASKYKSPVQNWFVKHPSDDDDDEIGSVATAAAGPSTSQAPAAATAAAKAKKAPAPTAGTSQSAAGHGKTAGLLFQGNNLTAAKAGQGAGSSQVKTASPGRAAQPKHEAEQRFAGEAMAGYEYEFATQEVSQEMTQELDQGATAGAKTIAQVLGKSEVAIMMPDRISRNKVLIELSSADDNQAVDLSGDSGAVGRVLIVGKPGSEQLRLDLKGMLFSGTVLALPGTAFVLNIGSGGEAKVEMLVHDFIRLKEERGGLAGDAGMDGNLAQYMDDDDTYQMTDGPTDGTTGAPTPDKAKAKSGAKPKKSREESGTKASGKPKSKTTKKPSAASASAKRLVSGLKASGGTSKRKSVSGAGEDGSGKASTPKITKPSAAAVGSSKQSGKAVAPASAKAKPKPKSKRGDDSDEQESEDDGDDDDEDFED